MQELEHYILSAHIYSILYIEKSFSKHSVLQYHISQDLIVELSLWFESVDLCV